MDRIRYIYQENQGPDAARNTGIRASQGEFIGLLDADDLWHPCKLELQLRVFQEHPRRGLVARGGVAALTEGGRSFEGRSPRLQAFPGKDPGSSPPSAPPAGLLRRACPGPVGPLQD